MVDSPSTSAGATVAELFGGDSARSSTRYARAPLQRVDAPADQLAATYGASGAEANFIFNNRSSEGAERFSNYLGFANEKKYDFNYRVFPSDLGSDISGHYMIININVQVNSEFEPRTNLNKNSTSAFGPANYTVTNEASRVDQLRGITGAGLFSGVQNNTLPSSLNSFDDIVDATSSLFSDTTINLPRRTRKIKEAIALYMPLPTVYTHTNIYQEVNLTSFGFEALKLGGSFFGKAIASGLTQRLGAAAENNAANKILDAAGNLIKKGSAALGVPINPKVEVLFSGTAQRAFRMEILMAPRNEQESITVKNIIDTFRFHAAPELDNIGPIPIFVPPAEFDITFYHKGKENTKIPRINTCALEQIEVDYAPTGVYSTFANGHPVAIRLSLAFRELEILHKQRVAQGF
jgi:hypothetical protein